MDKTKSLLVTAVLAMCAATSASGAVSLPDVISDYMVLQQNSQARLWGWSDAGAKVIVSTSWNGEAYETVADRSGRWQVQVTTPAGSYSPYSITFADDESSVTVSNVLIGEVWLCSGQSNMEMPLNGFFNQPVENGNLEIAYSGQYKGKVRMANVARISALEPIDSVPGKWQECIPVNSRWFSAVGYYFAVQLNRILDVPVGMINSSWGGSSVYCWNSREALEQYDFIDFSMVGNDDVMITKQPTVMYNSMIYPVSDYTIKGFIWNQGEANIDEYRRYPEQLANMVRTWRELWGLGELPFYSVEIPPHSYGNSMAVDAALMREAQHFSAKVIPSSGVICTNDLSKPYEADNIHPSMKQPVGERLALMAAVRTYGIAGIVCDSPEFKSIELSEGGSALLHFDNIENGFVNDGNMQGFEAAGADGEFHPATATLVGKDIKVTCDAVGQVKAVRYCFRNWQVGTVRSADGLPLVPFRAKAD